MKSFRNSKGLYWGLIIAFFILYVLVGFVSTLHSITFFELANTMWMAVLLGITYEVGQATVLFSLLMTKNGQKFLPWVLMILLTALQVTANVYASFKFMDGAGMDWTYWQRSILFWMQNSDPEMFKVVISWISGALLPIVALGMTALVAENLKMADEEEDEDEDTEDENDLFQDEFVERLKNGEDASPREINHITEQEVKDIGLDTSKIGNLPSKNEQLINFAEELLKPENELKYPEGKLTPGSDGYGDVEVIQEPFVVDIPIPSNALIEHGYDSKKLIEPKPYEPLSEIADRTNSALFGADKTIDKLVNEEDFGYVKPIKEPITTTEKITKKPSNNVRGWHLKKEHIDDNGDVYEYGIFQSNNKIEPTESEEVKK